MGLPMGLLQKLDQAKDLQAEIGHEEDDFFLLLNSESAPGSAVNPSGVPPRGAGAVSASQGAEGSWEEILPVPSGYVKIAIENGHL